MAPNMSSDEALMLEFQRGSREAFAELFDRYHGPLYGFFRRRLASQERAEDLTQETFLAAVTELKKGKRVRQPSAWVYGIARHKLLDHYRREQQADRQLTVASMVEEINETTLAGTDESQARDRAIAALSAVAASQRAALVLCYVDGYSVPEAARLLDKSVEAVESLLARGRQTFKRSYLEERA